MKIIISPDSFKESLTAAEVAEAIARGILSVWPQANCVLVPMADGGEGTVQALVDATGGEFYEAEVSDPLGRPVMARYGLVNNGTTAVIEMAEASGLHRVSPAERDPRITSSFGTGQLILAALDTGARHLILGLGGSATNDGGAGMLEALGARLLNDQGQSLEPGGAALAKLDHIDLSGLDKRLATTRVEVASDVTNVLCGDAGASAVFGPQKGATPDIVRELDACLNQLGQCLHHACGQDYANQEGAGAAGGLGVALLAALKAELKPGVTLVAEAVGLAHTMRGADLVITGEGRLDSQTIKGKTPMGVAREAIKAGIPVIAIGGSLSADAQQLLDHGFSAIYGSVQRPMPLEEALDNAAVHLEHLARNIAATLSVGNRL